MQRYDEWLAELQRDFNETLDRIRVIEQKALKKLPKKVADVKQSAG